MSTPPATVMVCPRCECAIEDKDLEMRGGMPAIIRGELVPGEWVEHTKGRCGKWLWRPKEVAA